MPHQALKNTLLRKTQQGDELKPGNVWVITLKREIIQVPKEVYQKNKNKFHDGGFFNKGQAMMYKENKTIYAVNQFKCPTCNAAPGEVCTDKLGNPHEMHRTRTKQDPDTPKGRYRLPKSIGIPEMKKLTEAALKQLVTWWEGLPQPDKEKIANSSNRPQMAKLSIDKWQERDLEALITYAGKNNVLFEIATVLRLERDNLNDKKKVNSVKEDKKQPLQDLFLYRFNDGKFTKTKVKLYSDNYLLVPPNKKPLPAEDFGDYFLSPKDMTADQAFEKWNVKEGKGMEWSSDAEAWMDQAYDQLDDEQYLVQGVMKKFNVSKPAAVNLYNKIARTRDPLTYRTGAMMEMATAQETWDSISKWGRKEFCNKHKIMGISGVWDKDWNQISPEIQDMIKSKMILRKDQPVAKKIKESIADEIGSAIAELVRDDAKHLKPGEKREYSYDAIGREIKGIYGFAKADALLKPLNVHILYDPPARKFWISKNKMKEESIINPKLKNIIKNIVRTKIIEHKNKEKVKDIVKKWMK